MAEDQFRLVAFNPTPLSCMRLVLAKAKQSLLGSGHKVFGSLLLVLGSEKANEAFSIIVEYDVLPLER